jgi:hypothetical protein
MGSITQVVQYLISYPIFSSMKLIFATNNQHKVDEARVVIGVKFQLLTLKDE